jgi:hypothetical protein
MRRAIRGSGAVCARFEAGIQTPEPASEGGPIMNRTGSDTSARPRPRIDLALPKTTLTATFALG